MNIAFNSLQIFSSKKTTDRSENMSSPIPSTTIPQWKDTIPFVPPITEGIVIKVYDGDTITIATTLYVSQSSTPYHNHNDSNQPISPVTYRMSIRLVGIDAPEMKTKNPHEKELAKKSQEALQKLILNKTIQLKNISTEKYGRILADVYVNNLHVNQWLTDNKYAVKYDGGTKKKDWNEMN
jgi:endonuclease YncB( thermonuclease family)